MAIDNSKNSERRKTRAAWLVLIALIVFLSGFPLLRAQAADSGTQIAGSMWNCAAGTGPLTMLLCLMAVVVNGIGGLLIQLGLTITALLLRLNPLDLPAVQGGFSVALAVANLGFVIGIIVIAIATILRRQTYGIKQLLWRLIVAAIVVNFALTISGVILNFSNTLTTKFMESSFNKCGGISDCLKGAIPLPTVQGPNDSFFIRALASNPITGTLVDLLRWDKLVLALLNLIFVAIFVFLIAFTFLALGIMLLVRYAYVALLLVLAPLAWLTWVFPAFRGNFSKWWSKFIRWAFFPPLVVFFLFLAMASANSAASIVTKSLAGASILQTMTDLYKTAMSDLILIALALGGLFAANSLSISGAGYAIGAAKGVGNAVGGYLGKQGKKAGRAALQKTGVTEALEAGRIGALGRVPGLRRLAGIAGARVRRAEVAGGGALVEEEYKNAPKGEALINQLEGSRNMQTKIGYIKSAMDQGLLDKIRTINGVSLEQFMEENKEAFPAYHNEKLFKDLEERSGFTENVRKAQKEYDEALLSGDAYKMGQAEGKLRIARAESMQKMPDAGYLAPLLKSNDEITKLLKEGKHLPYGYNEKQYLANRDAITPNLGTSLSPSAFSALLKKLDRFDSLQTLTDQMKKLVTIEKKAGRDPRTTLFNERILNWMENSPAAQDLGFTAKSIDLGESPSAPPQKPWEVP